MTSKNILLAIMFMTNLNVVNALVINEIMSNPTGDDSGREWIELYNNSQESVDLSTLMISIKGGSFVSATPVSGGLSVLPNSYAIIGSTVSGQTKFLLDYPSYNSVLLKASVSLVNTGVTSIEIKNNGSVADTLSSYTAAKEGSTYSKMPNGFVTGGPTPGSENVEENKDGGGNSTTTDNNQGTISQMSPPSADIVLYTKSDRVVVAGAQSIFSVFSLTKSGKEMGNVSYNWSFGDGGYKTGSSTNYRYLYPGRYIASVEGYNGSVLGVARINVKVVSPDINISKINFGKYGAYIDIHNPNNYDLDISDWKISIDGVVFHFPKNTLISSGFTRFSGVAMGFASTTVSSSSVIKLLFPTLEEVVRVNQEENNSDSKNENQNNLFFTKKENEENNKNKITNKLVKYSINKNIKNNEIKNISNLSLSSTSKSTSSYIKYAQAEKKKDTKIADFIRSIFGFGLKN